MVRRLAGEDEDRNALEVLELPGRLRLQEAAHEPWPVGLRLPYELELIRRRERRFVGHLPAGDAPWPRDRPVGEVVRRALGKIFADRRTARLDGKNALHQVQARIGGAPADHARLGMGEQHRRSDAIEQLGHRFAVELLDHAFVVDGLDLARIERVESRISLPSRPRPLRVQARLRPQLLDLGRGETLLDIADRGLAGLAVDVAEEPGASAAGLVDDIDCIAIGNEIARPAPAAVGRAEKVRRGLAAAMDHHYGVGARPVPRDLVLNEHLPDHDGLAADLDIAAGHRERALVCDLEGALGVE